MINIKKIILLTLISLLCAGNVIAKISDSLYMTVGNKPVTLSDIVNEIKIILILNNESYSEDKRDKLQEMAVKSIINRSIKRIELERNNFFKLNPLDFENEIKNLAININVDIDTLKNICASNDLDFSIIEDRVKADLFWNSLIFQLYKNKLSISSNEINEQLKLAQNKKKIEEYLISEILIKPIEGENLDFQIKELKNKIKVEGFENVAKTLSVSESSIKGGDLGWVNENIISKKVKSAIVNTPVDAVSEVVILPEGILIYKIRDKRELKNNQTLEETKERLVNLQKQKILNMHSISHYDKVRKTIIINFFDE